MKEIYYLDGKTLPTIPVPHDCVIKNISLKDRYIEFVFEDDISYHDSVRAIKPEAKSLIVRYRLLRDADDLSVYKRVTPPRLFSKMFSKDRYKRIDHRSFSEWTSGKYKPEYLYHNVGYCSVITKLFSVNGDVILDANVDRIEFEWIV